MCQKYCIKNNSLVISKNGAPVKIAVASVEEGRKIFGNRAVAGGFANTTDGVLYSGTEEQIKAETKRILSAAGSRGVILGADCTIPRGTPASHIQWVREAAEEFGKG